MLSAIRHLIEGAHKWITEIEESVPAIVSLLRDSAPEVCQVACGTLQNLSRDPHGRHLIASETSAVPHLTDLLCSSSLACQVRTVQKDF